MRGIFTTLILFGPLFSSAAPDCAPIAQSLLPVLAESRELDYAPLMCPDNVDRLITRLLAEGISLNQAEVVHIHHKGAENRVGIYPKEPRLKVGDKLFRPQGWSMHAFLVVDGFVLDMDYKNKGNVLSLKAYLLSMWGEEALKDFLFQSKPAVLAGGYVRSGMLSEAQFPSENYFTWLRRPHGVCSESDVLLLQSSPK